MQAAIGAQGVHREAAVVREDARDGKAVRQIGQHLGRGQQGQGAGAFPQHQQARDVVNLGVHQQHGSDAAVALGAGGLQLRRGADLGQHIGGGIDQQPIHIVGTDGDGRLGARPGLHGAAAQAVAIGAVAIPLGEAAAGGRP